MLNYYYSVYTKRKIYIVKNETQLQEKECKELHRYLHIIRVYQICIFFGLLTTLKRYEEKCVKVILFSTHYFSVQRVLIKKNSRHHHRQTSLLKLQIRDYSRIDVRFLLYTQKISFTAVVKKSSLQKLLHTVLLLFYILVAIVFLQQCFSIKRTEVLFN